MNLDPDTLRRLADFTEGLSHLTQATGIKVDSGAVLRAADVAIGTLRTNCVGGEYELDPT